MKFLWYNSQDTSTFLARKRNTVFRNEGIVGDTDYKSLTQINQLFSKKPHGMVHDISEHVAHPFNIATRTQYQYRRYDLSFEQTCHNAAQKILSSTDKPIAVTWSGGIDSTVALVSLLQVVPAERLYVVCNHRSQLEYPRFYQEVIHNKIKTIDLHAWSFRAAEFLTVSGDAGDTMWGAIDDSFYRNHQESFDQSWKQWVPQYLDPDNELTMEFIEQFCSWSGVDVRSVLDLRIWFYLCCKWQDKAFKLFCEAPCNLGPENLVPFYDVDNTFMLWTMHNLDQIIGNSWTAYKVPAKEFIHSFHPDDNYLKNKTKEYSDSFGGGVFLQKMLNNQSCFAIDENYQHLAWPSWPFVDTYQFENWNRVHQLIPVSRIEC